MNNSTNSSSGFYCIVNTIKILSKKLWQDSIGKKYIFIQTISAILDSTIPVIHTIVPGLLINELTTNKCSINLLAYLLIIFNNSFY